MSITPRSSSRLDAPSSMAKPSTLSTWLSPSPTSPAGSRLTSSSPTEQAKQPHPAERQPSTHVAMNMGDLPIHLRLSEPVWRRIRMIAAQLDTTTATGQQSVGNPGAVPHQGDVARLRRLAAYPNE